MGCGESDSESGQTALLLAAGSGHTECVRLLIDAGADKNAKNNVRCRSLLFQGVFSFILSMIFLFSTLLFFCNISSSFCRCVLSPNLSYHEHDLVSSPCLAFSFFIFILSMFCTHSLRAQLLAVSLFP